jgi:hypothetical protein
MGLLGLEFGLILFGLCAPCICNFYKYLIGRSPVIDVSIIGFGAYSLTLLCHMIAYTVSDTSWTALDVFLSVTIGYMIMFTVLLFAEFLIVWFIKAHHYEKTPSQFNQRELEEDEELGPPIFK